MWVDLFLFKKYHRHSILKRKQVLVGVIDIGKPIQVYFIDVNLVLRKPISSIKSIWLSTGTRLDQAYQRWEK